MYDFGESIQVNITSLSTGDYALEPTAVQYHTNRINCIYRKGDKLYIQYSDDRGQTWSSPSQIIEDNSKEPCLCRSYFDGWALVWSAYTDEGSYEDEDWEIKFCQALAKVSVTNKLISASVDRGMDMIANGFSCNIEQENFEFDFQNKNSIWGGLIIPGNSIEFFAGLGNNLDRRFRGIIDNSKYNDMQGQISISARGNASRLIDRNLQVKKVYSTDYTYTQAIVDLLNFAGLRINERWVQSTSLKISAEKIFDRQETFSGAIKNLCDDIGWIIWEDEDGMVKVGSPTNYPTTVWNYHLDRNCFSFSRNLDRSGIPSKVVVSNEDLGIERSANVETHDWVTIDSAIVQYLTTEETNGDAIQQVADNVAADLSLKIFTIDIAVPFNFYIQVRDRINIYQTTFDPVILNKGIIIKVSESIGQDGMYSRLTVAVEK